nr:hypothetical protein MS307 [uncultured bacterium]
MQLPSSVLETDQAALSALQRQLIELAEGALGVRDKSKTIGLPQFEESGPYIINFPAPWNMAQTVLSFRSKSYWPTALYEMAHETVHLRNPISGYTNWLEEGVAVAFAVYAQQQFGVQPIHKPESGAYLEALHMVESLVDGPFVSGRRVREHFGSLGNASAVKMYSLFPVDDPKLLDSLCEQCVPR